MSIFDLPWKVVEIHPELFEIQIGGMSPITVKYERAMFRAEVKELAEAIAKLPELMKK